MREPRFGMAGALFVVVGACATAPVAMAQASQGDQGQQGAKAPPPAPVPPTPPKPVPQPPRDRSGELGGVKMRLPDPLSNRGSLLEQRMRPMPGLVIPSPPPQSVNSASPNDGVVVIRDGDPASNAWIFRQRGIASGGVSVEVDRDGVRRIRLISPSPVGVYVVPEWTWWKYPGSWYRSNWYSRGRYWDAAPVGDTDQKPDRFVQFKSTAGVDYLDPSADLSEIDRAELAMRAGDWKSAVISYRDQVSLAPSDAESLRMLGVALVLDGKVSEGVLSIALAHERQPELGRKVMNLNVLRSESDAARCVSMIMTHAMRVKTAEGFLAATVAKQATGAKSVAKRMLDRAKDAGLSPKLEAELRAGVTAMR